MKLKQAFDKDTIRNRVTELGAEISRDYKDQSLVALCVLKGAVFFFSDLVRSLSIEPTMDFVRISSYSDRTCSSGKVAFTEDMKVSVAGRHVLIVEDIVDTGRSMSFLRGILEKRNPLSISICALIDKRERRKVPIKVDYTGFDIQEGFLVGYGLDYADRYRNLPGIYQLIPGNEPGKTTGEQS